MRHTLTGTAKVLPPGAEFAASSAGLKRTTCTGRAGGAVVVDLPHDADLGGGVADAPAADRRLHERIALTGPPDEIKRLADTFDQMLARLDHSLDGQRRFVANASHELRTPLTLNRTLLEVAVARRSAGAGVHQLSETLLEFNARHERLIEGLLVLANSDRALGEQQRRRPDRHGHHGPWGRRRLGPPGNVEHQLAVSATSPEMPNTEKPVFAYLVLAFLLPEKKLADTNDPRLAAAHA